jgi:hypothetical protein
MTTYIDYTQALYALYPQTVRTTGETIEQIVAYDSNNDVVAYDAVAVQNEADKNACKQQAVALLQATDWTTIPDVANPSASNPYLMNQGAFIAWRSQVRALAVNPVANPVFPAQPTEQWSQS